MKLILLMFCLSADDNKNYKWRNVEEKLINFKIYVNKKSNKTGLVKCLACALTLFLNLELNFVILVGCVGGVCVCEGGGGVNSFHSMIFYATKLN